MSSSPAFLVRHFRTDDEHGRAIAEIALQVKTLGDACRMAVLNREHSGRMIGQLVRDFFSFDVKQGLPPEDLVNQLVQLSLDTKWDETILVYCGTVVRIYIFYAGV